MKLIPIPIRVAILGTLAGALHAKDPVLTTPGTATWTTEETTTGTRTVFTLTKDTVLDWEHLDLKSGSEMVFNFTDGKTVVNFLGGTVTHLIDGAVTSNGIVAFFSPTASLQVNGSIIAKGVTLATLNADANEFSSGNGYKMSGPAGSKSLSLTGQVEATDGDVVLGGQRVNLRDTAQIKASRDVLIAGGTEVAVAATGDRRIKETSGLGFVLHNGESGGSRIEVAAGREIRNRGIVRTGSGRIFLEVGEGGKITNESSGVIVGDLAFNGSFQNDGVVLVPEEGDVAPPVGDSTLAPPQLSQPDGTEVNSEPKTFDTTTPTSGAGQDSNRGDGAPVASVESLDGYKQAFNVGFQSDGVVLVPDEGDAAPPVSDSTLTLPKLSRPDGTQVNSEPKTFNITTPMSASSDAGRDSNRGDGAPVASVASLDGSKRVTTPQAATYRQPVSATSAMRGAAYERAEKRMAQRGAAKSLLQRSSFFGMRGGDAGIAKH